MSRKTISLFYPVLVYLSLIDPISLFSIIPLLFFLYNRILKRYSWLYFILGTFSLLIAFFFFQMTTVHEIIAIISASIVAMLLRESEKVPFWVILVGWLGLLGWFSGPLAVFCVLLTVWMEWEWYKKIGITIILLILLFFPITMKTSVWWLPKYDITRMTEQRFGFHNYEGKYHQTSAESDAGAGTKSEQVSFARPITWMDSIVDWTVFILMILLVLILARMLIMLKHIRQRISPHFYRTFLITGISTLLIGGLAFFYRLAFMNFKDLPPDSPITAILQQFREPKTPSTAQPGNTAPIVTVIRNFPPAVQYIILGVIAVCMLIGIILLLRLFVHLFQISLVPDREIDPETILPKTPAPRKLSWEELKLLPVSEIIDYIYTSIRANQPQTDHLTPYEYLSRFPSEALKTITNWIVRLHYAPGGYITLPSQESVRDLFTTLLP